jgi:hypothetical protein
MSDRLVAVAAFGTPVEANLAKNRLEAGGVQGFLSDEETVGTAWHLTNAVGGIKLQVRQQDVEQARAVLAQRTQADGPDESDPARGPEEWPAPDAGRVEVDEDEPVLTNREQNADRALRGAILGLLLFPLQLYGFWLLLKVFVSDEHLGPSKRRNALVAAVINLPLTGLILLLLRAMWGH